MKDYKKYYLIDAEPEILYSALTNPYTIQLWSGEQAEMNTQVGFEFSLWEGSITGKNLEFEENKKIVQEWYFGDQEEKSIVTIKLHPDNPNMKVSLPILIPTMLLLLPLLDAIRFFNFYQ